MLFVPFILALVCNLRPSGVPWSMPEPVAGSPMRAPGRTCGTDRVNFGDCLERLLDGDADLDGCPPVACGYYPSWFLSGGSGRFGGRVGAEETYLNGPRTPFLSPASPHRPGRNDPLELPAILPSRRTDRRGRHGLRVATEGTWCSKRGCPACRDEHD